MKGYFVSSNDFKTDLALPVIVAPMFLVSGVALVKAACTNGLLGTFPALNARTTEEFSKWLDEIKNEIGEKPYGVNLIVHRSNPRLQADLEVCVKQKVPLVITSLGAAKEVVEAGHSYGGKVFHDVAHAYHGKKAADAGVDGIIAVSAGAGGHAGTINPFVLMSEIRSFFEGSVVLAGGLSTGRHIAAAETLGADFAYMGTRFIATQESSAQDEFKEMIVRSKSTEIIHTPAVSGVPANFMAESLEKNGFDMQKLKEKGDVDFGEKLTLNDEAKAWKDIWSAGHGVSCIDSIPTVAQLVTSLKKEYEDVVSSMKT